MTGTNSSKMRDVNYLEVVRRGSGMLATSETVADSLVDVNCVRGCGFGYKRSAGFSRNCY